MNTSLDAGLRFDPIDLLANMLCAEQTDSGYSFFSGLRRADDGAMWEIADAGSKLRFQPMLPSMAYTFDMVDEDRLIATIPGLLVQHPSEIIGRQAEIVMLCSDRLKWTGYRHLRKTPRGVWVAKPRCTLYEMHYREVFQNGQSSYGVRVIALDSDGAPVPVVIVGSQGVGGSVDGQTLIMAASLIEDCHRAGAIKCTITDHCSLIAPIPNGTQKGLFALRDGPMTPANRRKAILHYVMRHKRTSARGNAYDVHEHFRGVRSIEIDGLKITLEENLPPQQPAK